MTADVGELVAVNEGFYEAFETLDLDTMMAVWRQADDVYCIHPGGGPVVGWGPVRRSWAAVFAATSYLQFIVTDVLARVLGEVGVVTCTENMLADAGQPEHLGAGKAIATNVFVREEQRWRMLAHHASPVVRGGQG